VPGIVFPSVRHEVNAVVPPGAVEKAKARIARRGSVIDGGIRIRRQSVSTTGVSPDIVALRNSIAAEAAAAANAANNDVQIEIVEDDGDGHVITHK
jgi:hypothetical protein